MRRLGQTLTKGCELACGLHRRWRDNSRRYRAADKRDVARTTAQHRRLACIPAINTGQHPRPQPYQYYARPHILLRSSIAHLPPRSVGALRFLPASFPSARSPSPLSLHDSSTEPILDPVRPSASPRTARRPHHDAPSASARSSQHVAQRSGKHHRTSFCTRLFHVGRARC